MTRQLHRLVVWCFAAVQCATAWGDSSGADAISFNEHIRPIFAQHCIACHGGVKRAGGISFVYEHQAVTEGESGMIVIAPGDPDGSYLMERVSAADPEDRMPPSDHGPALSAGEIDLLRRWISEGAKWEQPWSFTAPVRKTRPNVNDESWSKSPMDRFVLARLEQEGLKPTPPAPRAQWLRRVTLDLTGVPPTRAEVVAFETDTRADVYELAVDRLLASPRFGERWAAMWLDLARYADTRGYEQDLGRDVWPYRDWLIRAFNSDMPFDKFTQRQLAGDMLPGATLDDRLATTFHRNTQTNDEGGTDDEEFRVAAVINRVNTTWQVWCATTFGCVQCHSHPYDPIEHDEFYQFFAIFNTSRDADLNVELPMLDVPQDAKEIARAQELDRKLLQNRRALHARFLPLATEASAWTYLPARTAESTNAVRLRTTTENNVPELLAEGTMSFGSKYTLEFELPSHLERMTALRIDVLPTDLVAALRTPEPGFMVSKLEATLIASDGGKPIPLRFELVLSDDPQPLYDPQDSLHGDANGWGEFTRLDRPAFAVFVATEPLEISPGSRLKVEIEQNNAGNESTAMLIRRARFAVSASHRWNEFRDDAGLRALRQEIQTLATERQAVESISVPTMVEQTPSRQRKSFRFVRGNWMDKADEALAGVPAAFPSLPADKPHDRLALAKWLTAPDHPLTARVAVNRFWEQLFGIGLVETVEDFGSSGTPPSHPELLDDLAFRFAHDMQWSTKQLLREIALSAAYGQSATQTSGLRERDPRNRLLARGPRNRLTGEMVRDQALAISGLLSPKMYGPPVMPFQPEGIWRSVYSDAKWTLSEGNDRYRRAVYTYWKRTSPYPSFVTFDAPSREVCTARRINTNTPLQALVTLNDPVYHECAESLARRMAADAGASVREQIAHGYELATGERANVEVLDELVSLHKAAKSGARPADEANQFALTVVAAALLNLDSVLSK